MKALKWGAVSAVIFVAVWTLAKFTATPMPPNFVDMQPVALVSVGFFWGYVACLIKERVHG